MSLAMQVGFFFQLKSVAMVYNDSNLYLHVCFFFWGGGGVKKNYTVPTLQNICMFHYLLKSLVKSYKERVRLWEF